MSLDKSKTDPVIGHQVANYLTEMGVETPIKENYLSSGEKVKKIEQLFSEVMDVMGLDLSDDSLIDSPKRVANMFVNEIYWGLDPENFPKITVVENKIGYDEMVLERHIAVNSNCEHHFIIIDGVAHVAYIPNKKVLGLSKLNRIVEYFSKRPQIQERLTAQIYHTLSFLLDTDNIAVMINAKHYCVKARGVEDINSDTITSKLGGCFKNNPQSRNEFLNAIRL